MKQEIKTTELNIKVQTPLTIIGIDEIYSAISQSKRTADITGPALELAELQNQYEVIKKAFKEAVKEHETKLKGAEMQLERATEALKQQALKLVNVKYNQKVNKETGEVTVKTEHDLNTSLFSFTPATKQAVVDTRELIANPKKYKKFLKQVITYEVDFAAISKAKAEELPYTEKSSDAKLSFKTKIAPEDKAKLLEVK